MSRTEEVNKMTENVYKVNLTDTASNIQYKVFHVVRAHSQSHHQGILDQFNPSLKNFVVMGKHYEKALTGQSKNGVTFLIIIDKKKSSLNLSDLSLVSLQIHCWFFFFSNFLSLY